MRVVGRIARAGEHFGQPLPGDLADVAEVVALEEVVEDGFGVGGLGGGEAKGRVV